MHWSQIEHGGWRRGKGTVGPLIMICVGAVFLARNFDWGLEIGRWWPVLLVLVGIGMIVDRIGVHRKQ